MNETILFFLIIAIVFAILVSIALKNDKEINEQNIITNSENLSEEQKILYLSVIENKNNIKKIKNIAIAILLIILIPIIIRVIAALTAGIAFNELF